MCGIHRRSEALRRGSLIPLKMERDLVSYGRVLGREKVFVFVYTGEEEREIVFPVWLLGILECNSVRRVMLTYEEGYNVGVMEYPVRDGMLTVRVSRKSAGVFLTGRF